MARINFDARKHAPKANEDRIPARYSKLGPARRVAVRERYEALQGDLCHHCGTNLHGPPRDDIAALYVPHGRFPPGFFDHPIHLHHNHRTDMTIGAVHAHCNAVLWHYHGE